MLLGELYSPGLDSSLSSVTVCHIETSAARRRKRQVHLRMFAAGGERERSKEKGRRVDVAFSLSSGLLS